MILFTTEIVIDPVMTVRTMVNTADVALIIVMVILLFNKYFYTSFLFSYYFL